MLVASVFEDHYHSDHNYICGRFMPICCEIVRFRIQTEHHFIVDGLLEFLHYRHQAHDAVSASDQNERFAVIYYRNTTLIEARMNIL